jgi:hypothetical protein
MVALPAVLSYLANRMESSGAAFAHRSLELVGAALSFLRAIGIDADDDTATAAITASLLAPKEAVTAAAGLGVSIDTVPQLTLNYITDDLLLCRAISEGPRPRAIVAATLFFVRYCVAAKQGNNQRKKEISDWIDLAKGDAGDPEIVRILSEQIQDLSVAPLRAPERAGGLLSVSIDLSGSTEAKSRILEVARNDRQRVDALNELIMRAFARIETQFYREIVSQYATFPVNIQKLFAVKSIGDEIWLLCHVSPEDFFQTAHSFIDAGLRVSNQSVHFLATENEEGPQVDRHFNYGRVEPVMSPVKVYIDAIFHASNLGTIRDESLRAIIPELLRTFHRRDPTAAEIAEVTSKLCLDTFEPLGGFGVAKYRTDYIGHEIDRFFRASKKALSATVTIGAALADAMELQFRRERGQIKAVYTNEGQPLVAGSPRDELFCYARTIPSSELRGIGYAYKIYNLFGPRALRGRYVQLRADEANGIAPMPYHDVVKRIPEDVVADLARRTAEQDPM